MTLDEGDVRGRKPPRNRKSGTHCLLLSARRRRQKSSGTPVIAQSDPANHAGNGITVALGVHEMFKHDKRRPLRGHQSVCFAVKRSTTSGLTERVERGEATENKERIGCVHTS